MGEQKQYEPLVDRILERLEADRQNLEPAAGSGEPDTPHIIPEPPAAAPLPPLPASPSAIQDVPQGENSRFYADISELAELAGTPEDLVPDINEHYQQSTAPASTAAGSPAPNMQIPEVHTPANLFEPPVMPSPLPVAPEDTAQEMLSPDDELPALFQSHPLNPAAVPHRPVKNILFGLTGATLLGAVSVLMMSPDISTTGNSAISHQASQITSLSGDTTLSNFTSENSIISAKTYIQESAPVNEGGSGNTSALPPAAKPGNGRETTNTRPGSKTTGGQFASIDGPVEELLDNVARDLQPENRGRQPIQKTTPPPAAVVPGAEATISQLEKSLASISEQSSGSQIKVPRKIILAQNTPTPGTSTPEDKMKVLTDEVVDALSALGRHEEDPSGSLGQSVDDLRSKLSALVQEAESRGKNAGNVEMLLKEALGKNHKNLPAALKNADGSLDITSLIASVVKKAGNKAGGSPADSEYLSMIESEGNRTTLTSRLIRGKAGKRYLIVKPGDTLSSIAYATYGDSFLYPKIYQANRNIISNPNALGVGMRLVIPE